MNIRAVIAVLNEMQAEGVVERYAIGGAVGATFYLEPVATLDVDVFVSIGTAGRSLLLDPSPIFAYLFARGAVMEGEYVVFENTYIQFLPPMSTLVEAAIDAAAVQEVDDLPVRVFTPEHLAAIALETGRGKDKARLIQFLEAGALDIAAFEELVSVYGLASKWEKFKEQFGVEP